MVEANRHEVSSCKYPVLVFKQNCLFTWKWRGVKSVTGDDHIHPAIVIKITNYSFSRVYHSWGAWQFTAAGIYVGAALVFQVNKGPWSIHQAIGIIIQVACKDVFIAVFIKIISGSGQVSS